MTQEIVRELVGGVWVTRPKDQGGSSGSQPGLVGPITVTFEDVVALTGEGEGYYVIPVYTLPAGSMLRGAFGIAGDTPLDNASGATYLLAAAGDDFYNAAQQFNGSAPTSGSVDVNGWLNGPFSYTTNNIYTTEDAQLALGYWSDPDGPPTEGSALIWLDIALSSPPA